MKPAITLELPDEKSWSFFAELKPSSTPAMLRNRTWQKRRKIPTNIRWLPKSVSIVRHAHAASACVVSAAIESELIDLPDEDAKAYLADL